MSDELNGFTYRYEPAASPVAPTLLLLHGTGGNESDLLPLRAMTAPQAAVLSPRGQVVENGMPRFFRRLAEGVFDIEDLTRRTRELAAFVAAAAERHRFDPDCVYAVGFSNGANIAASVLLLYPRVLTGAILFRGMVPLVPDALPLLHETTVLLSSGTNDPFVPRGNAERLATMLRGAGAQVEHVWQPGGHELSPRDVTAARDWLARQLSTDTNRDHA